jgi:hypothetical protein
MVGTIWFLALSIIALVAVPAQALGVDPKLCGGRFASEPDAPLKPGCRRWDCQLSYRLAQDDKGAYCVRVFACAVYCPKPKQ